MISIDSLSNSAFRILMCLVTKSGDRGITTYAVGSKTYGGKVTYATTSPEYQQYYKRPDIEARLVEELLKRFFLVYVGERAGCSIFEPSTSAVEFCRPFTLTSSGAVFKDGGIVVMSEEEEKALSDREANDPNNDIFHPR